MKIQDYRDLDTDRLARELETGGERRRRLLLLAGPWLKTKQTFAEELSKRLNRPVVTVDCEQLISPLPETYRHRLDDVFDRQDEDSLLLLENGDLLCGTYTSHTYSKIRYSTPQVRYLLEKTAKSGRVVLLEIKDEGNVDVTLKRSADALIRFGKPGSFFEKLKWKLRNIHFQGYKFTPPRQRSPASRPGHRNLRADTAG